MPLYDYAGKRPTLPADGSAWIAPSADVIGDVHFGEASSIWFGAVIRADNTAIMIGARSNIQEGSMLHSDPGVPLTLGEGVTVGHHAMLHGCTVGDNSLVGMGATILNRAVIGPDSLVAANALVTEGKSFPPRSMIMGAPAKVVRELSDEEVAGLRRSAQSYVDRSRAFATGLKRCD